MLDSVCPPMLELPSPALTSARGVWSLDWIVRVCRSVLLALLLTWVCNLRGTDIAVFTKLTQDGQSVSAPPRARVFALPLFLT